MIQARATRWIIYSPWTAFLGFSYLFYHSFLPHLLLSLLSFCRLNPSSFSFGWQSLGWMRGLLFLLSFHNVNILGHEMDRVGVDGKGVREGGAEIEWYSPQNETCMGLYFYFAFFLFSKGAMNNTFPAAIDSKDNNQQQKRWHPCSKQ